MAIMEFKDGVRTCVGKMNPCPFSDATQAGFAKPLTTKHAMQFRIVLYNESSFMHRHEVGSGYVWLAIGVGIVNSAESAVAIGTSPAHAC
jgi:hypothetical protein